MNCKHTHTHARKVELRNKLSSAKLPFELCQKNSTETTEKKINQQQQQLLGLTERNEISVVAALLLRVAAAVDVTLRGSPLLLLLPRSLPRTQAQRLTHTHTGAQTQLREREALRRLRRMFFFVSFAFFLVLCFAFSFCLSCWCWCCYC